MRAEAAAARAIAALPPRAQVRLAGGEPVVLDGQRLDPSSQVTLALIEKRMGGSTMQPGKAGVPAERALFRRQALIGGGDPEPVAGVRDLQVDGAEGKLGARFYSTPEFGGPHPLLVFFHGGGFVLGDLDSHDTVCRTLCVHAGVDVLSVDYRLAPEHPFPVAPDDARAALAWAQANAADLGSDPTRIAVGGDSAGGNLAAVVSRDTAKSLAQPPVAQLLIYPVTDWSARISEEVAGHPSHAIFGEGFLLTNDLMEWFADQYAGPTPPDVNDPRVSPLKADDHSGLPPAVVVTAGFDPLRDEGEAYAEAMRSAGVDVVVRRFPDLIHGFANMTGVSKSARAALVETAGMLRAVIRA